jgi:tetratricopeptide (TPR) repeat protein
MSERTDWKRLMQAWKRGDYACVHELARAYTQSYPLDLAGWINLADILVKFRRFDQAARLLPRGRLLSRVPVRYQIAVWSTLGSLHRERGDYSRAVRCYRKAVELGPRTSTLVFLGAALARTGDLAGAKRCHRRAARLATENPDEAYCNLGLILRAERRYEQAIACFDRAIEHDPKYTFAFEARRDCLRALAVRRGRHGTPPRRRSRRAARELPKMSRRPNRSSPVRC